MIALNQELLIKKVKIFLKIIKNQLLDLKRPFMSIIKLEYKINEN